MIEGSNPTDILFCVSNEASLSNVSNSPNTDSVVLVSQPTINISDILKEKSSRYQTIMKSTSQGFGDMVSGLGVSEQDTNRVFRRRSSMPRTCARKSRLYSPYESDYKVASKSKKKSTFIESYDEMLSFSCALSSRTENKI